jgi:hypothetical protein
MRNGAHFFPVRMPPGARGIIMVPWELMEMHGPDILPAMNGEGSFVLHLSSPSDGSCFNGPLGAVPLHRLQRTVRAP